MKKHKSNKFKILGITFFIVILIILIGIISSKFIKQNNAVVQAQYQAGTGDSSDLIANYIKEGVKIGGIEGKLKVLDTSDATATPADINKGKTAYVNGVKIVGTYEEEEEEQKEKPVINKLTANGNSINIQATGSSNIVGYATSTSSSTPYYFSTVSPTKYFNVTVKGLYYDTFYYVWVKDENGLVSDYKTIWTEEEPKIKPSITKLSVDGNSINIQAIAGTASIVGYATSTSSSTPSYFNTVGATSSLNITVNNLNYNTLYYVWVKDQDGLISDYSSIRTEEEAKIKPSITNLSVDENSIRIQARGGTSRIVGYATSTSSYTPSYFTSVSPTFSLNVTVSGLNYDTLYYVWVKDEDGLISDYSSIRTEAMVTIPALTQYNTTFTPNITYWTNQSVTVRVSTSVYGYTLQTATSNPSIESSWSNTSTQTLSANGTIYARLTDGEHIGSYTSYNVTNIDTTLPRFLGRERLTISKNNSERRVVLQLNFIADTDSGIAKIVYYYKRDTDSYFTASNPINYATINGTEKGPNGDLYYSCVVNFDSDITNSTVYMYAKIYDVAGNVINTALATLYHDGMTSYGDSSYVD